MMLVAIYNSRISSYPELLFRDYLYVSGTSAVFVEHFREYFSTLDTYLKPTTKPFVVEIGSNDGTLLQFFLENNYRILGVDPAQSLAEAASGRGITTIPSFFNKELATELVEEHDKADAIIANNVCAHIPDIRDFTEGDKRPYRHFTVVSAYWITMSQLIVTLGLFCRAISKRLRTNVLFKVTAKIFDRIWRLRP